MNAYSVSSAHKVSDRRSGASARILGSWRAECFTSAYANPSSIAMKGAMFTFASHVERRPLLLRPFTAAQLMTTPPIALNKHSTVQEAATLMRKRRLEAVPLVDDAHQPVALAELSECIRHELSVFSQSENSDGGSTYAFQIATPRIYRIRVDATGAAVIQMLLQPCAQRLYVVTHSGALAGVISRSDVLRHLLHESIGPAALLHDGPRC